MYSIIVLGSEYEKPTAMIQSDDSVLVLVVEGGAAALEFPVSADNHAEVDVDVLHTPLQALLLLNDSRLRHLSA